MDKYLERIVGKAQWIVLGAGAVAFIVTFFPWYSVSIHGSVGDPGLDGSANAWSVGFAAWFPMLLLVALAGLIGAALKGVQIAIPVGLQWVALGVSSLAAFIVLIRWLTYERGNSYVSAGAGFGLYIGLLAALATVVASVAVVRVGGKTAPLGSPWQATPVR